MVARVLACRVVPFLCVAVFFWCLTLPAGKDDNWDQKNYHFYLGYSLVSDRVDSDFLPANIQSYLNPLPYLPFYLMASSDLNSITISFLLTFFQCVSFILLFFICRYFLCSVNDATFLTWLFSFVGFFHPIVLASIGTSLVDLLTIIPLLGAILILVKSLHFWRLGLRRLRSSDVFWFGFLGAASIALKPTNALFVMSFLLVSFFWMPKISFVRYLVSLSTGAILGGIIFGGLWYAYIWFKFGSPMFPLFDHWFNSEYFDMGAVANDRFIRNSFSGIFFFPFHLLQYLRFVVTEVVVLDTRPLLIGLLICTVVAKFFVQLFRYRLGALSYVNKVFGDKFVIVELTFLVSYLFSYLLWCFFSGNGRYGLPLILLSGPVLIILTQRLFVDRFRYIIGVFTLSLGVIAVQISYLDLFWQREEHQDSWFTLKIPDESKHSDGLYVSVGLNDRTSNSFIVPFLPESVHFINLAGYLTFTPEDSTGREIIRIISLHEGPIIGVLEGAPIDGTYESTEGWSEWHNTILRGFGLGVDSSKECHRICENNSVSECVMHPFASICSLVRVEHQFKKVAEIDFLFEKLEGYYTELLYPSRNSFYNGSKYCRFYESTEYSLCEYENKIYLLRNAPYFLRFLGSVDEVKAILGDNNRRKDVWNIHSGYGG